MKPYLSREHPIRFAHRGGAGLWPENTMLAFQSAYDLGIRYMETDVHLSADGVIVVFHDHDLDRLTNGTGKVGDWRWSDLRVLDAAYGFQPEADYPRRGRGECIPRLDELVAAFPDVCWNIDMKHTPVVDALADFVGARGAADRVLASSFYDHRLWRFRRASGGRVATSAGPAEVARMAGAARLGRSASIKADALQVPESVGRQRLVNSKLVDAAHAAGVAVHVWTINDAESMSRLLDLGVDGIITDRPDVLIEVVSQRGG
jgi:glycerophosphoryl diester phosphodiesterase